MSNTKKTPCHKCKFYDQGNLKDPRQKCRVAGGEPAVITKPLVFNGCKDFQPRPRFAEEYQNERSPELH